MLGALPLETRRFCEERYCVASFGEVAFLCKSEKDLTPLCEHSFPAKAFFQYLSNKLEKQPACQHCYPKLFQADEDEEDESESSSEEEEDDEMEIDLPPQKILLPSELEEIDEEGKEELCVSSLDTSDVKVKVCVPDRASLHYHSQDLTQVDSDSVSKALETNWSRKARSHTAFLSSSSSSTSHTFFDRLAKQYSSYGQLLKYAIFIWKDEIFVTRLRRDEIPDRAISEIVAKMYAFASTNYQGLCLLHIPALRALEEELFRAPDKHPFDFFDPSHPLNLLLAWKIKGDSLELVGLSSYRDNLHRGDLRDWIASRFEYYNLFFTEGGEDMKEKTATFLEQAVRGTSHTPEDRLQNRDVIGLREFIESTPLHFAPGFPDMKFHPRAETLALKRDRTSVLPEDRTPTLFEIEIYRRYDKAVFVQPPSTGAFYTDEFFFSDLPSVETYVTEDDRMGLRAKRAFSEGEVITAFFPENISRVSAGSEAPPRSVLFFRDAESDYYLQSRSTSPSRLDEKWLGAFCEEAKEESEVNASPVSTSYPFSGRWDARSLQECVMVQVATRPIREGEPVRCSYSQGAREGAQRLLEKYVKQKQRRMYTMKKWTNALEDPRLLLQKDSQGLDINGRNLLRLFYDVRPIDTIFQADYQRGVIEGGVEGTSFINKGAYDFSERPVTQALLQQFAVNENEGKELDRILLKALASSLKKSARIVARLEIENPSAFLFALPRSLEELKEIKKGYEKDLAEIRLRLKVHEEGSPSSEAAREIQQRKREIERKQREIVEREKELLSLETKRASLVSMTKQEERELREIDLRDAEIVFRYADKASLLRGFLDQLKDTVVELGRVMSQRDKLVEDVREIEHEIEDITEENRDSIEKAEKSHGKLLKKAEDLERVIAEIEEGSGEVSRVKDQEGTLFSRGFTSSRPSEIYKAPETRYLAEALMTPDLMKKGTLL